MRIPDRRKSMAVAAVLMACAPLAAAVVSVDLSAKAGRVKPVNGVGQPPMVGGPENFSMMHLLTEAGIPYARLHDVDGWFGKNMYVDIPNVFRDFDADETDPANYDFAFTDRLMLALEKAKVEPVYRLGVTIENFAEIKSYRIDPPKDYAKWARIAEHVIRHYTEGWADGFRMKVEYWEIWNEPDNYREIGKNRMWRGDWESYVRFYGVVSRHLKGCFPHLKVGGYGSCGFYAATGSGHVKSANSSLRTQHFVNCFTNFLDRARSGGWPLDFFSFHSYSHPDAAKRQIEYARRSLDEYGFRDTEMCFNEWLPGPSHAALGSARQASLIAAELIDLQNGPCDSAMIYDARCGIGIYSPLFNPLTYRPHKAYYSFVAFNELRGQEYALAAKCDDPEVRVAAAGGWRGRTTVMIANTSRRDKPLSLNVGKGRYVCRIIDETRTYETTELPSVLPKESVLLVQRDVAPFTHPDDKDVMTVPAEAGFEIETGSLLHIVDWPIKSAPYAAIRNQTMEPFGFRGKIAVEDAYGRSFELPVGDTIGPGGVSVVGIPLSCGKLDAKGVWTAKAELERSDGRRFAFERTFAVLDRPTTAHRGRERDFRWGMHLHLHRHSPGEVPITLDAAQRMGAEIVRIDHVFSGVYVWSDAKGAYDWTRADSLIESLKRRNLALNAIVHEEIGNRRCTDEFYTGLASRYGEDIAYYEIGNEWDLLSAEQMTPAEAVRLQKRIYAAIKKGCRKARVITNGWAVEDSDGHANVRQKGFQEYFMREAKGSYDLHTMHLHFRFEDYVRRLGRFFAMRSREGVDVPWLLNETALSRRYRGEREVAENVWKKILYAWARGAKEYIWYNLRATKMTGGYYSTMTRDYRPRLAYAAFTEFSSVFGDCTGIETLVETGDRYVYRLKRSDAIVLVGWDGAAVSPMPVKVRTDAGGARAADVMNNETELRCRDGIVEWRISAAPSALVLEGATSADADAAMLGNAAVKAPRVIFVEKVRPDYGWDLRLHKYEQVHELYPADPSAAHRTWKGPDDLSGILIFRTDGKRATVHVSVTDDKDTPGDRIEIWRDGIDVTARLGLKRVRHGDSRTTYDAEWPFTEPCRVNVRFYDDDGNGGIDAWMDYEPFDAARPDPARWPLVRFN